MSHAIYKELTEDMIRRMRNWARSNAGLGVLGMGMHPMWRGMPHGTRGELPIGIISGEASDTDTALGAIPIRYAQAVKIFWQYEGRSMQYLGSRCACDYRTFERRVIDGHVKLRCEIVRRTEKAREMREQFELSLKTA